MERTPDWPPWFGFVGFAAALVFTVMAVAVLAVLAGVEPGEDAPPAVAIGGTVLQNLFLVIAALVLARTVVQPRAWHFGLRRAPFWKAVGWAAGGMLAFYVFTAVYATLVEPTAEQDVVETLGADDGKAGLIAAGLVVVALAPFVEELFFRGFFYRALRTRYPVVVAAVVDGLIFGLIHFNFDEGADAFLLIPPLAFLGMIFCFVYERTGTLWAPIGMHAFNNAVAFSVQAEDFDGWQVAVVAGPLMLIACAVIPKLMRDGPAPLPPPAQRRQPDAQLSLPVE